MAYYPPYHSKYNLIERCWGILENHWNGTLLKSIETVLRWAKTMTCAAWLRCASTTSYNRVRLSPREFSPLLPVSYSKLLPK